MRAPGRTAPCQRVRSTLAWLPLLAGFVGAAACSPPARIVPDDTPFYLRSNGSYYHYVRESGTRFSSITQRIERGYYAQRGVQVLSIYCPYEAAGSWRGVPARNFFTTNANTGTVADFGDMVAAAHAHAMSVIVYMGLLFVDDHNEVWIKAQADRAQGIDSPESSMFRWAKDERGPTPAFGSWRKSEVAGEYYAASFDHPAIDLASAASLRYLRSVLAFWLDLGVDGFEYDAPNAFWGGTNERLRELLTDFPEHYTKREKYLIAEGPFANADNQAVNDAIGFTHVLLSGDDDESSVALEAVRGTRSLDELERYFAHYIDARRAAGRGVRSVSVYDLSLTAQERAFEAAVLAGNGSYMEIDYDAVYSKLNSQQQQQYDQVFRALASSSAEAPGAQRVRLSTGASSATAYAVLRTSGSVHALNVYNFAREPATIRVDLADTEIDEGAVAFDLVQRKTAAAVSGRAYTLSLPGLGYALLRFGHEAPR